MEALTVFHPQISSCREAIFRAREALGRADPAAWALKNPSETLRLAHQGLKAAATETLLQPALDRRLLHLYLAPDTPLADPPAWVCHPLVPDRPLDASALQPWADATPEALHTVRLLGLTAPQPALGFNSLLANLERVAHTHPMTALALVHRHLAQRLTHPQDLPHGWPQLSLQLASLWQAPSLSAIPGPDGWTFQGPWPPLPPPFNRHLLLAATPDGPHWFVSGRTGDEVSLVRDPTRDGRQTLMALLEDAWFFYGAVLLGMLALLLDAPPAPPDDLIAQRWTQLMSQREVGRLMLLHAMSEQPGDDRWIRAAMSFWHLWRAWGQTCWKSQQFRPALGYDSHGPAQRQWSALWHVNAVFGAEEILATRLIAPWLLGAPIRR